MDACDCGKATCFKEAQSEQFKAYQQQVAKNANALANALIEKGHTVVSGGTDNHLFMIDLRVKYPELIEKIAQNALDKANITANKNTAPGETRSPFQTSGIRIGTIRCDHARGMVEEDMLEIAKAINLVLEVANIENEEKIAEAKAIAVALCEKYPLPY